MQLYCVTDFQIMQTMSEVLPTTSQQLTALKKTPSRFRWFPFITKVDDTYYLHLGYKTSRGEISELRSSKKNSVTKIPFGSPVKCDFYSANDQETDQAEFSFTNSKNYTVKQKLCYLDCFVIEHFFPDVSLAFAKKVASLIVERKEKLLCRFFALISHSRGFDQHREDVHTDEGEEIEDTIESSFLSDNSILKDFKEFYAAALESAKVLNRPPSDIRTFFVAKRKNAESSKETKKKPHIEIVDEKEMKEIEDASGLEKRYYKSLFGLVSVPLSNLKIHPGLVKQLDQSRVESIISSMMKRFDPSLNVPVICPTEGSEVTDLSTVSQNEFLVITKIHTVKAFMDLDSKGQFVTLSSHENGTIPCFVANLSSDELVHYGNFRNNDVNYQFSKHSAPQDLLKSYVSLFHKSGAPSASSFIERMAYLARFAPDVTTALRKLCHWSITAVTALVETVAKYEKFETTDKKPNNYRVNLSRQERMVMPDRIFKRLGKITEEFFMAVYQDIVTGAVSLLSCIEDFEKKSKMEKVSSVLSAIAEFRTYENIRMDNPGMFDYEQLKHFFGAEIRKNGSKNKEASRLEDYYKSVVSGSADDDNISFVPLSDIKTAVDAGKFDTFQVLVAMFKNEAVSSDISNLLLNRQRCNQIIILIFPSLNCKIEVLNWAKDNVSNDIGIKQIFFQCEGVQSGAFEENLMYAILAGNVKTGIKVKVCQEGLGVLPLLVSQISSIGSTVAAIVGNNDPLFKIHSDPCQNKVTYFGSTKEVNDFRISLIAVREDGELQPPVDDDDVLEDNTEANYGEDLEDGSGDSNVKDIENDSGSIISYSPRASSKDGGLRHLEDSGINLNEDSTSPFKYDISSGKYDLIEASSCIKKL